MATVKALLNNPRLGIETLVEFVYVMNSNKRGSPNNKEQILSDLKEKNDKMHLSKIMTLIGIKIEEKFRSFAKAFLFFDKNGDQMINKSEFIKGVEGLRVKLPR